jgi:hypothetical protein
MSPSIDVIDNFRKNITPRRTIYDQISYLKDTPNKFTGAPAQNVGGADLRRHNKKRGQKRGQTKYWGGYTKEKFYELYEIPSEYLDESKNEDEKYYYDPDTLDLLWLLYKELSIPEEINTPNARLDYIEDFVFFMYPYFIFLGEASFDIGVLQKFHDKYYIIKISFVDNLLLIEIPSFVEIISDYVNNVIIPRENPREQIYTVVLSSNQRVFLDEFGLNNNHITLVETRMKDTIVTTFENELRQQNIVEQAIYQQYLANYQQYLANYQQYLDPQFHTGKPPEPTKRNKTRKIPRKIKSLRKKREWVKSAHQQRRNKTKRKPTSYSRLAYSLPQL